MSDNSPKDAVIRLALSPSDNAVAAQVLDEVWGTAGMVSPDVITAAIHCGGYCSLAGITLAGQTRYVGASFALASNTGILHSHVTGVVAKYAGLGVGYALKMHQLQWAREHGYSTIGWTFDPLVRRNAWFNLVKLGAQVVSYHENFYGELNDSINQGEQSDRLLVHLDVDSADEHGGSLTRGDFVEVSGPADSYLYIGTPDDIEGLRGSDSAVANNWRRDQRQAFRALAAPEVRVVGLNSKYEYVVSLTGNSGGHGAKSGARL